MTAFEAELRARLDARMAEIDDEQRRIGAALAALSPGQARQQRPRLPRAPRGHNRKLIRRALRNRKLSAAELGRATGIARGTLGATLTLMKQQGALVHSNGRWGLA